MDRKEALRGMLQDVINDRMEQAAVTMHDYFIAKTREVAGLGVQADKLPADDETVKPVETDEAVEAVEAE